MKKIIANFILIIGLLIYNQNLYSQYTYRGRVYSKIRQVPMTWGNVEIEGGRRRKQAGKVDSLGYFSFTINHKSNIHLYIDCVLDGEASTIVSYADTLIIMYINNDCYDYNEKRAQADIDNGEILLLCDLGYASYKFSQVDKEFEQKYKVKYYTFADEPIWSDCMWLYNRVIGKYLDNKYGDGWRKEVRWDVPLY
jgi:hypothetical protein